MPAPAAGISLGDLDAHQTACGVIDLTLTRSLPADLADLHLRWRVAYRDTVMRDRHVYEDGHV